MALKEEFGGTPREQINELLGRFKEQIDVDAKTLTVLETAQQYAHLLSDELAAVYGDPNDPDIGITAWDTAWDRVEETLTDFFFNNKLQILASIDDLVREVVPDLDPLSFPSDHEDPSIATFYRRFGKNLPKPISTDTHIGRKSRWSH